MQLYMYMCVRMRANPQREPFLTPELCLGYMGSEDSSLATGLFACLAYTVKIEAVHPSVTSIKHVPDYTASHLTRCYSPYSPPCAFVK
jgi:hypothetical protein